VHFVRFFVQFDIFPTSQWFISYDIYCPSYDTGEKFRLCHFDAVGDDENDKGVRDCLRFKLQSNKETKFVDIGMLRMDGANDRTVVFYPKG
jgi:hypothetical protein